MTTLAAAVFFVGSFMLVPLLPTGFIPPDDLSQTQVTVSLPPGSTFAADLCRGRAGARAGAEEPAREAGLHRHRRRQRRRRPVRAAGRGRGAQGDADDQHDAAQRARRPEQAGHRKRSCARLLEALPGARVKVGFGGSSEKYVLVLAGEDGRVLAEHARQVERELRTIPGIGNVTSTSSLVRPELIVRPDFARPPTWA